MFHPSGVSQPLDIIGAKGVGVSAAELEETDSAFDAADSMGSLHTVRVRHGRTTKEYAKRSFVLPVGP